nr:hypothetical protein [uncultured Desulfuromonas sp.]
MASFREKACRVWVTDLVGEITASSDEQSQGISQIHIGLEQIDMVTQQNTSNAVQSAATGEQLAAQSAQMRDMLAGFKLEQTSSRELMGMADFS